MLVAVLVGQGVTPPIEGFASYGVLGLVTGLLFWFAWQVYKREVASNDEKDRIIAEGRARELAMAEKLATDVTAALSAATAAINEANRRRRSGT